MLVGVRHRALIALTSIALVLGACGSAESGVTAVRSRPGVDATVPDTATPNAATPDTATPDTGGSGTATPVTGAPDTGTGTEPPDTATGDTTFDTGPVQSTVPLPADQTVIDFGSTKTPRDYDGFLVKMFQDIEAFWTVQFPEVYGSPFVPLKGGIFAAYKSRQEPIPGCGEPSTAYKDVEGNAFYCSQGDFIVYDDDELMPELVKQLGQSSVGVVLAHEFGHAIQQRIREFQQPTILKEQQADCFAGAWAAHLSRGESPGLTFDDTAIKQGLIAMIQVRDPVDGDVNDPNAHGSGFDRVGAFQDGFLGGTKRCKTFFTEAREKHLIDIPFDRGDTNAGNLPVRDPSGANSDIVTLMPHDLDRFWVGKIQGVNPSFTAPALQPFPAAGPFPACDGVPQNGFKSKIFFCPSTNAILMDEDLANRLDADPLYGDMSVGYLIGDAYSEAVQRALKSTAKGAQRELLNDCFTGAWVADDIPPLPEARQQDPLSISLSAGDLDEAIITALQRADNSADDNRRGTAFQKIESFRAGVLGGIDACRARLAKPAG